MTLSINFYKDVSMPYHGLSSFLQKMEASQADTLDIVSMPYHGLSSFLLMHHKVPTL